MTFKKKKNGVVYSLHNILGERRELFKPGASFFNLIEACHTISGLCFQWLWVLLCRRTDNKREKDYSIFAHSCLRNVEKCKSGGGELKNLFKKQDESRRS